MKNKKLLTAIVVTALVGVIGVGATLAYFTDSDVAKNVLTLGHVDIDLDEPNYKGDDEYETIVPGDVIEKDPIITLESNSEDAYVRMKLEIDIKKLVFDVSGNDVVGEKELDEELEASAIKDLMDGTPDTEGLTAQIEANGWYYNETDGYYYFCEKLTQDNKEAVFFTHVDIPLIWGNKMAETIIRLDVYAEAIQADNYEPVKDTVSVNGTEKEIITGWIFGDGTPITGEYIEEYNAAAND